MSATRIFNLQWVTYLWLNSTFDLSILWMCSSIQKHLHTQLLHVVFILASQALWFGLSLILAFASTSVQCTWIHRWWLQVQFMVTWLFVFVLVFSFCLTFVSSSLLVMSSQIQHLNLWCQGGISNLCLLPWSLAQLTWDLSTLDCGSSCTWEQNTLCAFFVTLGW